MKDTFVLRKENRVSIDRMSDADAGALFKAILAHADGDDIDLENAAIPVQILYPLIAGQIDRADAAYQETCDKRAEAGRAGGVAKAGKAKQTVANDSKAKQTVANDSKPYHSEPEPDNDPEPDDKRKAPTEPKEKRQRFVPPTVEEVKAYADEKGLRVDAERFVSFYESKNWMVGKNKMTSWKAAVSGWATRDKNESPPKARDDPLAGKYSALSSLDYSKLAGGRT